jgi:hypothetical protein
VVESSRKSPKNKYGTLTIVDIHVKEHKRPSEDFRVTSVAWELDIEARHRKAGFDPIGREVILRRFFAIVDLMQRHGMATWTIAKSLDDIDESSDLRNSDLTDDGFHFLRLYHGKWLNRMHKDGGEAKECAVLEQWLQKFRGA